MRDVLLLGILQIINYVLPLLVMLYLIRPEVLGAAGYGQVGFAYSLIQYAAIVVDFGFNFSATKKIAQAQGDRAEIARIYRAVMTAKTLLLGGTLILLAVVVGVVPKYHHYAAATLATLPMLLGIAYTPQWLYQGLGRISTLAKITIASRLLIYPLIFVFVRSADDVLLACGIQSVAYLVVALVSQMLALRHETLNLRLHTSALHLKQEMRESLPLFLSSVSSSAYTQLFLVILGLYATDTVIGYYSFAERTMRAACFLVFVPVQQAFFPKVSALAVQNMRAARALFLRVRTLTVGVMLLCSVALFFAAPLIGKICIGADCAPFITLLRIMAAAPMFIAAGGLYGQLGVLALGNQRAREGFALVYVAAGAVSLCLVFLLASWAGGNGAASALVVTEVFVCLAMVWLYKRT